MRAGSANDSTKRLWMTLIIGFLTSIASRRSRRRSAAGFMRLQCEGALIGSITARFAPFCLAIAMALHRCAMPGHHDLSLRIQVGGLDHLALRSLRAHALHRALLEPEDRRDPPGAF